MTNLDLKVLNNLIKCLSKINYDDNLEFFNEKIDINNVNELSEDLYQRIIDFIYANKPVVYYNTILDKFKYELKKYDVENQYLLKGLIDRKLPEDFYSKRDYISVGDKSIV